MKKSKKIFKSLLLLFVMLFSLVLPVSADSSDYDIYGDQISVTMDIQEDGRIDVKTILDVTFNESRQGIFVELPQEYQMTINDRNMNYFFPITDIDVQSHEVSVDRSRAGVVLRLGTEGDYLTGPERFEYSYTINTKDLRLDGYQMLYMNIVGQGWQFPIARTEFALNFPKTIDDEVYFYATEGNLPVDYTITGNTISGSFNGVLDRQALTVEKPLPEGYFVFPEYNYGIYGLMAAGAIGALILLLYFLFGRDPIVIESVEFEPPKGLSSAEIGYVYRGYSKSKDVISLIIYWASKGYLRIVELDEKKDDIQLEKIMDLSKDAPVEERRFFNAIFKTGDVVKTSDLTTKLGATVAHATANLNKRFINSPKDRVFDRKASFFKVVSLMLVGLIPSIYLGLEAYSVDGYSTSGVIAFGVSFAIYFILALLGSYFLSFHQVHGKAKRNGNIIVFVLVTAGVSFLLYFFFIFNVKIQFTALAVLYSISVLAAANTGRRTPVGARWLGQILGLRRFIKVAEKDRLIALVEETPEIFYNILPYAYVLGVTDVWSKKFESIAMKQPDWYVSSNPNFSTYLLWSSLNRSMSTINTAMVSVPAPTGSSGGGGSFGGGGGGGGGFSGGGFGGGGGGGW